jgi:glycosyltransferase involved in cell wall biosynthesis
MKPLVSRLPTVISLVPERFEDGANSGVPRFDYELRRAIPGLVSINSRLPSRAWLRWLAWKEPDAIVVTGNETSLLVPEPLRTIVVHHGCAQTHFDRDPSWRGRRERKLCAAQKAMYDRPRRTFVALARWTQEQFCHHYGVPPARMLPNWVDTAAKAPTAIPARPVVLGDWRNFNKGQGCIEQLQRRLPKYEFRTLKCTYETRVQAYHAADAYLCLSLSEGGSYAMSDAEAARLALVTTDVGNHYEYTGAHVLPWDERDDIDRVALALQAALEQPRTASFFDHFTFEDWQNAWQQLVTEVADTR